MADSSQKSESTGNINDKFKKYGFRLGELPMVESPFVAIGSHFWNAQRGPCGPYELDWTRCRVRVGEHRAYDHEMCSKYYADFMECANKRKMIARYKAMQAERRKQGRPYMEMPPPDSIQPQINTDYGMEI